MEKQTNRVAVLSYAVVVVALLILISAFSYLSEFSESFIVHVTNPAKAARKDVLVFIAQEQISKLKKDFNSKGFAVFDKDKEIASQCNLKDADARGIVLVLDNLDGGESKELTVRYNKTGVSARNYTKKTQAELSYKINGEWKDREYIGGEFKNVDFLRVPKQHKDHSWFIRYEGPGWESDKVGYRFYLDQRNATDVFGKTVTTPVLQQAGLDGFDSYHELQPWGMDVMKVGKSLGIGSLGMWVNNKAVRVETTDSITSQIDENGPVYSSILTHYFGWKTSDEKLNVTSRLAIHSGTRVTDNINYFSTDTKNLCTGIVKDNPGKLYKKEGDAQHLGYIATYGKQSLNKDNLGIAVLFRPVNFVGFTEDEFSHVVLMKSADKKLEYYFAAAWEGEPGGIKNEADFLSYLDTISAALANPVKVEIVKSK